MRREAAKSRRGQREETANALVVNVTAAIAKDESDQPSLFRWGTPSRDYDSPGPAAEESVCSEPCLYSMRHGHSKPYKYIVTYLPGWAPDSRPQMKIMFYSN